MVDDVLMKATIDAKTDVDSAQARLLVLTDELDQRRVTEAVCRLSTKDWLRSECSMTAREASGALKTARALAKMPAVAQQAVTGIATNGDSKDLRVAVSEWEQDIKPGLAPHSRRRYPEERAGEGVPNSPPALWGRCRGTRQRGRADSYH